MIYLATLPSAIYVLHAFQKKIAKTPRTEVELARVRLAELRKRG